MTGEKYVKEITEIVFHRNGVSGWPFYVVRFVRAENDEPMVAVVFLNYKTPFDPSSGIDRVIDPQVAVFSEQRLPSVRFVENSWRGDVFAPELYDAIEQYNRGEVTS